jgi:endogenous inhibitor of DNA gyrase (YacG/DUF329 family)
MELIRKCKHCATPFSVLDSEATNPWGFCSEKCERLYKEN